MRDDNSVKIGGDNHAPIIIGDNNVMNFSEEIIPSQLTSKLGKSTIIGRKKELQEIDKQLNSSNTLLLINGIGGVGKSNIASYYLHSHKEQFDYYGFFEGLDSFIVELREPLDLKAEKPHDAFLEALSKLRGLEGDKLLVLDDVKEIEENRDRIDGILGLKDSGYKILFTSREDIENIKLYYLDVLSLDDAKALFNSIYPVEDEALLEEILGYLDCHAFFVEKIAHSIKRNLTPQMLKEKFENGEFAQISVKRKQSFDKFLNQLFSLDGLDDEEILMLKRLSTLPSIEIDFEFLETIFQKKDDVEFEELLDYLCEKGWLTKLEGGYKLHQIIKEFIWVNQKPIIEEIDKMILFFRYFIGDRNIQPYKILKNYLVFFENIIYSLSQLKINFNENIIHFFRNLGNLYKELGEYKKAERLLLKVVSIQESIFGKKHYIIAIEYNNLGVLYYFMGLYERSEENYLKALDIQESTRGEKDSMTFKLYYNLAQIYSNTKRYGESVVYYHLALNSSIKVLGEKHQDTAMYYNGMAKVYQLSEKYDKAKEFYLKGLNIQKELFGDYDFSTSKSYNDLGGLYKQMKKYQKARYYYIKSLRISKKILAKETINISLSYSNLASVYNEMNDIKKSYNYIIKAISIQEKILLENHPLLINHKKFLEMIEMKL